MGGGLCLKDLSSLISGIDVFMGSRDLGNVPVSCKSHQAAPVQSLSRALVDVCAVTFRIKEIETHEAPGEKRGEVGPVCAVLLGGFITGGKRDPRHCKEKAV